MTTINHRICHEIQNKRIVPVSGGPLYLLCWSKAATTTTTGRGKHHSEFRPVVVVVAALDQHKRYKGPPLTGTIRLFWISWQILWFIAVITNSHTFPYILNPPTPPPKPGPPVRHLITSYSGRYVASGDKFLENLGCLKAGVCFRCVGNESWEPRFCFQTSTGVCSALCYNLIRRRKGWVYTNNKNLLFCLCFCLF